MSSDNNPSKSPSETKKFLNTLSTEEYEELTMTPGDRGYMYHTRVVDSNDERTDTNTVTSNEESDTDNHETKSDTKTLTD